MAYTVPQALVYQEFTESPLAVGNPLRAIVIGPNAELFRYSEAAEKTLIALGAYEPDSDTDYEYPNRPTGGIVDQDYFKLYMEDALLRYFHDPAASGGTQIAVASYKNRLRSSTVNYKENVVGATTYARDAALLDRDVQVGDIADVAGTVDGDAYTLRASVVDIIGDTVAATVDAAEGDDANAVNTAAGTNVAQSEGPWNCVTATGNATAYNGLATGTVEEVYTVTVTQSSTNGDFTTARIRVRSASGLDDADDVAVSQEGAPTDIGANGFTMAWNFTPCTGSQSAEDQDVSDRDLIEGQVWVAEVQDGFTAPTATSGGTYTGTTDARYIVEVTRGGDMAAAASLQPQITCITDRGTDVSGPTNLTGVGNAVNVGTTGVTIRFNQQYLRKGDVYYIDVTAPFEGDMRTLVLSKNMPQDFLDAGDLTLSLYIKKASLLIPRKREGSAPDVNYTLGDAGDTDTGFTVSADIAVYEDSWTDDDVPQPLLVREGSMFSEYRAWVSDKADAVYGATEEDMDDIPGASAQDNPLKFGVASALAASNGVTVLYIAVANPDEVSSWEDAIEKMIGYRGLHGCVPLTKTKAIVDKFVAHAASQSSPENGRWRKVWTALAADEEEAIVDATTSSDGEVVLGTFSDDPDVSGNQYRIVQVPAGNGNFLTNGVRARDIVRSAYTTDGWGDITYTEYVVDAVINEDELRVKTGPGAAVSVARKIEIWRSYTSAELATQIADKCAAFGSARVVAIWPDTINNGGEVIDSMFLACTLAGERSGVRPQQGMTNMEVPGYDDVPRTNKLFNKTQLDTMAEAGCWIVMKHDDGRIVTRHALTTAGYGDVATQEEMIGANVDSMSMINLETVEDLIGVCNVTPGTEDIVELRMEANIDRFKQVDVDRIGGQLIDGTVLAVRRHVTLADRMVVELEYIVPAPLNNLEIHQKIVV